MLNNICFRSEPSQGSGDDTAGINLGLYCSDGNWYLGDGMSWGDWSPMVYCPSKFYSPSLCAKCKKQMLTKSADIISGQIRNSFTMTLNQAFSMQGCKLVFLQNCYPVQVQFSYTYYTFQITGNSAICGLRTKIEPTINGDNTALNKVEFACCSH